VKGGERGKRDCEVHRRVRQECQGVEWMKEVMGEWQDSLGE